MLKPCFVTAAALFHMPTVKWHLEGNAGNVKCSTQFGTS